MVSVAPAPSLRPRAATAATAPHTLLGLPMRQLSWALAAAEPVRRFLDGFGDARNVHVLGSMAVGLTATRPVTIDQEPQSPVMALVDPAKLRC